MGSSADAQLEISSMPNDVQMKRLEGKVAIITGGARGIGESAVRLFVQHGTKLIIADILDDLGNELCKDIGSPDVSYVLCDVSNETDVQNVVDLAISRYDKLDIMFSNDGISGNPHPSIMDINYESFRRIFDVNVFGPLLCSKHPARVMIPAKKGSIIFTASVATVTYGDVSYNYVASKNAVVGLAKNLCIELGKYGIKVNCISPFGVATPMLISGLKMKGKEEAEEFVSHIANLKGAKLEAIDVAEAAVFLGSNESKYMSGQNLVIDGGYSLTNTSLCEALKRKTS